MKEIVKDNKDFARINRSFIVNTNSDDYQKALARRKIDIDKKNMQSRLSTLEKKLGEQTDKINNILESLKVLINES